MGVCGRILKPGVRGTAEEALFFVSLIPPTPFSQSREKGGVTSWGFAGES